MNDTEAKKALASSLPIKAGQQTVEDEATRQLSRLKLDSDSLLKQLMLEQQDKLQQMVQQLQSQSGSPEMVPAPETTHAADSWYNKPISGGEVPLEEVLRLQQMNMGHLDRLIARINATMKANLKEPESENDHQHGRASQ